MCVYNIVVTVVVKIFTEIDRKEEQNGVIELNTPRLLRIELRTEHIKGERSLFCNSRTSVATVKAASEANNIIRKLHCI